MEKTDAALRISWDGIACGSRGADIQYFVHQFEAVSDGQNAVSIRTPDRFFERTNLPCNTRYKFRVAGVNEVGMGPFSDDLEATTDFSSGKSSITLFIITKFLINEVLQSSFMDVKIYLLSFESTKA